MMKYNIKNTKGLSLVSLIVGMGLSAFILTVILQVLSNSKGHQRLADQLSEMNETLRFASYLMTNIVSYTGFISPPAYGAGLQTATVAFADTGGYYIEAMPDEANSNAVVISMQGHDDGQIRDCRGTTIASGEHARLKFYVAASSNGYNLVCDRLETTSNNVISTVNLIDDIVERVYFMYGNDSTGTGAQANRYLNGATVELSPALQANMYSLRMALIVRSRQEIRTEPQTQTFDYFGNSETFPNDRYIRKMSITTVPFSYVN